jgi:CheY-like chemotaxis protein
VRVHSEGVGHGSIFEIKLPVYLSNTLSNTSSPPPHTLTPIAPKNFSLDLQHTTVSDLHQESNLSSSVSVQTPQSIREERRRQKLFLGLKVLIVDDAPMVRKLMTKLLISKGTLPCDCAEDGAVAVEMMTSALSRLSPGTKEGTGTSPIRHSPSLSHSPSFSLRTPDAPYDIIFMDFMMPNMNGPEATRIIRSLGFHGLIIGITGNMMAADVDYFMAAGADIIFPKPLSVSSLEDYLLGVFSSQLSS